MALIIAQNDLINAKSEGYSVGVMAFDLSAAFDTLCHSTLTKKLESSGISGTPLKWFKNYLSGRSQCVLWNGKLSTQLSIENGVPHCSILGPILFLAMISDMPKFLTRDSLCASSRIFGYADDTTVYSKAHSVRDLKNEFELLASQMVTYCKRNGLISNSQKTQILTSTGVTFKVNVGQDYIPVSQQIKLLGIEYNSNFSTVPYLKRLSREAQTRAFLIKRLSFCMPPVPTKTFG